MKCCREFMAPVGPTRTALKEYLFRLEEAEKRDHRKLGKKFDLFHTQEEAPGMVFWHPKGWQIWQSDRADMCVKVQIANGYREIRDTADGGYGLSGKNRVMPINLVTECSR